MAFYEVSNRIKNNPLFKDTFWAVAGNGLGNFLLLVSGILIARILQKDLYGAYGLVKTTMFYVAAFSTFGLGYTSTKFIAEYIQKDDTKLRNIAISSIKITLFTSITLCVILYLFANKLADYINHPELSSSFRYLGAIIICRALSTVGAGLLGGFKLFKVLGINNVISGAVMLAISIPFTMHWGLNGALLALLISQLLISILNLMSVRRRMMELENQASPCFTTDILTFSIPVAIQELTYSLANWGASLLLTKYASLGEVGIYTACTQWNAIILFIPGLLSNVVLSYLSSSAVASDSDSHKILIHRMLWINFCCAVIPFLAVFCLSSVIASFYGPSFIGMKQVLNILILSTIFTCLSSVLTNDLISEGKNWTLFIIRVIRDIIQVVCLYLLLRSTGGVNAALYYAILTLAVSFLFLLSLYLTYRSIHRRTVLANEALYNE